jgi:two-component system chemotaxis response regulator CheY
MKKLLIVEDDAIVSRIYTTQLEKAGYQIKLARDGEEGLAQLDRFAPDLVLLDLMMPKMRGQDFLERMRSNPARAATPVFVFTNAFVQPMVNDALKAGATRVLDKSDLTPLRLLEILRAAGCGPQP